jgi:hypothetical protein
MACPTGWDGIAESLRYDTGRFPVSRGEAPPPRSGSICASDGRAMIPTGWTYYGWYEAMKSR